MPALLLRAQHALKAACEPAVLATRSLAGLATASPRTRTSLPTAIRPQSQLTLQSTRASSSSSSQRWKTRQTSDPYTKSSKLSVLKSRAAYKLLEINDKHKLFKAGQSVVDLGYAPGSWSQVAKNRVGESGRVVGIDVIPAQPPRGVSAMQGNFLSENVQERVRDFVREWKESAREEGQEESVLEAARAERVDSPLAGEETTLEKDLELDVEVERKATKKQAKKLSAKALDLQEGRVVDVVLSDMCAPFPGLELSTWINSVNRPYRRMMNTSGNPFRDHAGSIDLCMAALTFSHDCLVTGGHFLCKFYQGPEDKDLENRMKRMFEKVYRIKPDSSRKESRESYFVGLRRKADVSKEEVLG